MARYTIISGDDRQTADTLQLAKCIAGEMQLDRRRIVHIEREAGSIRSAKRWRRLSARRWQAVLTPTLDVVLKPTKDDTADQAEALKRVALKYPTDAKFKDSPAKERARRVKLYAQQWEQIEAVAGDVIDAGARGRYQYERNGYRPKPKRRRRTGNQIVPREVMHLPTGRRFPAPKDAAEAECIRKQSMSRRLKTRGSGWVYVDTLFMLRSENLQPSRQRNGDCVASRLRIENEVSRAEDQAQTVTR